MNPESQPCSAKLKRIQEQLLSSMFAAWSSFESVSRSLSSLDQPNNAYGTKSFIFVDICSLEQIISSRNYQKTSQKCTKRRQINCLQTRLLPTYLAPTDQHIVTLRDGCTHIAYQFCLGYKTTGANKVLDEQCLDSFTYIFAFLKIIHSKLLIATKQSLVNGKNDTKHIEYSQYYMITYNHGFNMLMVIKTFLTFASLLKDYMYNLILSRRVNYRLGYKMTQLNGKLF